MTANTLEENREDKVGFRKEENFMEQNRRRKCRGTN